jgi:O-antigen/teichoic acid export membrane protein
VIQDLTADPSENPPNAVSATSERQGSDWDIRNAPKNYVSLVLAHGATAFFSFASVWLITRKLGSEGYGGIIAFVAASQLVQIFLNWSSTALARFGIEEFVETGKITRSFWSRSVIFIPNLLLILAVSAFWLPPIGRWLKIPEPAMWLITVHLVATAVWLHIQFGLQGAKMLRLQGAMLAVERGLTFLGVLLLVFFQRMTLENTLWCYILPPLLLSIAGAFILRRFVEMRGFVDMAQCRKILTYSLPLIPFAIVGYLSTSQLDAFFITRYLSTRDLGIYAVAAQINGMVLQLPIMATSILMSLFVSLRTGQQDETTARFFRHILPTLSFGWGLLCVTAGLVGSFLVPLVFGAEFAGAGLALAILLTASAATAPSMFGYAAYSHAISATYISAVAATAAALVNVVFNFLLIPRFGLAGCAAASLFSAIALNFIVVLLCRQESKIEISWIVFAVIPSTVGIIPLLLLGSTIWAFVTSAAVALVVAIVFHASIRQSIRTVTTRVAPA